ncbi:CybS-domain-containing protein [Calycina marina]|uniref:Succinate dehydrogenase [ubiquinone] cytochrome b small subunit n=1 Tax=Calycina marina TaxID=1763456 RepID=A0A9P7YZ81_9HELO|nr:CybS-domain-containing protein [Calycina marina]
MASFVRPALLRQSKACLSIAFSRTISTSLSTASKSIARPATRSNILKLAIPGSTRVAALHASARRSLLPVLPQSIDGTANDAAPVPETNPSHGSYHWTFERALSVGLVPLTIAPFAAGSLNPGMDALLCATILIHSHIGFDALITDYLPNRRVPKTKKTFDWGLRLATILVGVGFYEFETNDVGVTEAIRRIWTA